LPKMSIQLKIMVVSTGVAKVLRFAPDMTVHEVQKEIKLRTETGGADFGLYQPPINGKKARWLQKQRTLKYYDIASNVRTDVDDSSRLQIF
jgi:hypothetical protein